MNSKIEEHDDNVGKLHETAKELINLSNYFMQEYKGNEELLNITQEIEDSVCRLQKLIRVNSKSE